MNAAATPLDPARALLVMVDLQDKPGRAFRAVLSELNNVASNLSTATIRAVALGVLGVAFIQAIVIGLIFVIAGIPFAALLALVLLVLGIAQVPGFLVTLPVIV